MSGEILNKVVGTNWAVLDTIMEYVQNTYSEDECELCIAYGDDYPNAVALKNDEVREDKYLLGLIEDSISEEDEIELEEEGFGDNWE